MSSLQIIMLPISYAPQKKKVIKKIKRYVPKPEALSVCLINPRSCNNKTILIKQFINDLDLDICAITETWLKEGDKVEKVTLKPYGYEVFSSLHLSRLHGGIGTIHKEIYELLSHMNNSLGPVNEWILKSVLISVHTHWVSSTDQKTTHSHCL